MISEKQIINSLLNSEKNKLVELVNYIKQKTGSKEKKFKDLLLKYKNNSSIKKYLTNNGTKTNFQNIKQKYKEIINELEKYKNYDRTNKNYGVLLERIKKVFKEY